MHLARRIFVGFLITLLPLLLLATALDYGITSTAGNPAKVKKIAADSGIYQNIIPAALDQAQQNSKGGEAVSLADPAVKSAAEKAFSPQFLRQTSDNIIDGVYRWLDGKAPQPDFRIDMSGQKAQLATLVAAHAQQVAASLPRCSFTQSEALARLGPNFDVFNAKCLPIGVTPVNAAAEVKKDVLGNKDFLKDPVITADSFKTSNGCQPTERSCASNQNPTSLFQSDAAKKMPGVYQWLKRSPFILAFLSLLVMLGVVFIGTSRRRGLRQVGVVLLVSGLLLIAFAWGLNKVINNSALPKVNINDNAVFTKDVKSLVTDLTQDVDKNFWIFGGVYSVLGVAAILTALMYRRAALEQIETEDTKADKQKPGPKPRPKPPKKSI